MLSKARLLRSIRGAHGGYRLSRRPEDYTVGEILRLAEGGLAPVECLDTEENLCPRRWSCSTLAFWEGLDKVIRDYVDSVTLADLTRKEREARSGGEYCI